MVSNQRTLDIFAHPIIILDCRLTHFCYITSVSFAHCCVGESGVLGLADALQKGAVIEVCGCFCSNEM